MPPGVSICDFQGYIMKKANKTISRAIYEHGKAEALAFAAVRFFCFFFNICFSSVSRSSFFFFLTPFLPKTTTKQEVYGK